MYCAPLTRIEALGMAWDEGKGLRLRDRIEYTRIRHVVILKELKFGYWP